MQLLPRFLRACLCGRAEPVKRILLSLVRAFQGDARFLKCRSFDWSGAYRIHADFAVFEFHGPGTQETAHSRLSRGIDSKGWQSHYIRDRGVQDDRTPIFEKWNGLLHSEE